MRSHPQEGFRVAATMAERLQRLSPFATAVAPRQPELHEHFVHLPTRLWKLLLVGGAAIWLVAAGVTALTADNILVPTVIVVGSFLVPVTMAAFALSRRRAGY